MLHNVTVKWRVVVVEEMTIKIAKGVEVVVVAKVITVLEL